MSPVTAFGGRLRENLPDIYALSPSNLSVRGIRNSLTRIASNSGNQ